MSGDAVLDAAIEALDGEEATAESGYYGGSYRIDGEHAETLAAAVVAAVRPLISSEVRQEVAQEIDAIPVPVELGEWRRRGYIEALETARDKALAGGTLAGPRPLTADETAEGLRLLEEVSDLLGHVPTPVLDLLGDLVDSHTPEARRVLDWLRSVAQ